MLLWQAILLGFVQGLTEFLPVSSSGHLVLVSAITGCPNDVFFDITLHFGTLIPLLVIFKNDVIGVFKDVKNAARLIVATIPAGIVGLFFGNVIEGIFDVKYLPVTFAVSALMILTSERFGKKAESSVGIKGALFYGLFQTVALLPGVSRSGACLSAGNFLGVKKDENVSFSFLMSVPVIVASLSLKIVKAEAFAFNYVYLIGAVTAAVSGAAALVLMRKISLRGKYSWFAGYMLLLSAILIVV